MILCISRKICLNYCDAFLKSLKVPKIVQFNSFWMDILSPSKGTLALIHNRYDIFTLPQPPAGKLLEKQWQILQHVVKWIEPTNETWTRTKPFEVRDLRQEMTRDKNAQT